MKDIYKKVRDNPSLNFSLDENARENVAGIA